MIRLSVKNNDFIWLIMDDAQVITKSLVDSGLPKTRLIEYYYKENGSMHTARNAAYENCIQK